MEIKIDEGVLQKTVQESVKGAIVAGMNDWQLKDAIGKAASEAINGQ